jgi:hypothetical protein
LSFDAAPLLGGKPGGKADSMIRGIHDHSGVKQARQGEEHIKGLKDGSDVLI